MCQGPKTVKLNGEGAGNPALLPLLWEAVGKGPTNAPRKASCFEKAPGAHSPLHLICAVGLKKDVWC